MTDYSLVSKRKASEAAPGNDHNNKKPRVEEEKQDDTEDTHKRKRKRDNEESECKRTKCSDMLNCNELLREMKKLRDRNRKLEFKKEEKDKFPSYSRLVKWINEKKE